MFYTHPRGTFDCQASNSGWCEDTEGLGLSPGGAFTITLTEGESWHHLMASNRSGTGHGFSRFNFNANNSGAWTGVTRFDKISPLKLLIYH